MPIPIAGPISPDLPVRTIERDELERKLAAKDPHFKLVMTLGAWEFKTKHIPGSLHFEEAVNITLGLPIVRTAPDHGTAFDIAGRDNADPRPMAAAIRMACQSVSNRGDGTDAW